MILDEAEGNGRRAAEEKQYLHRHYRQGEDDTALAGGTSIEPQLGPDQDQDE